jgi:hypothetical protein
MSFDLNSYVDVAERITAFYDRFPDGRLVSCEEPTTMNAGGKDFVVLHARAYRTPDDPYPGDGWAWEPVPGPTQFTKDSELMNAQTAAWGRAIVALGFNTKKIASAEEVRNRQGSAGAATDVVASSPGASPSPTPAPAGTPLPFGKYKGRSLEDLVAAGGKEKGYVEWLASGAYEPKTDAQQQIKNAAYALTNEDVEAAFAGAFPNEIDDIPFERTI